MARSLVLGNGNVLVCYDEWAQVRDFHYPYVGMENHVGEPLMHRLGVHVDGATHWLSDGGFRVEISYERDTLVASVVAVSDSLELELHFTDIVYNETDIFVRTIEVVNSADRDRDLKVFFNQQFHISESSHGDTGYYSPELHALIHYKGRRVFLVSARSNDTYFDDYSVGLLGIEGKEGTWRDADDGQLQKSGIEHGTVDSVLGVSLFLRAKGMRQVSYWIAAGTSYRDVEDMHRDVLSRGPDHLTRTTRDFWNAWVNRRTFETCGVDDALFDLYHRSLLVMRAHADNRGAIIASADSSILQSGRDTYNYCWPRDAAYIVNAFLRAGHVRQSEAFHNFCNNIVTEDGYLLHKYRSDKSLGSSWHPWVREGRAQPPIQEDETAMTLITLGAHYELTRNVEFIENLYNPYIKRVADFLCRYRDKKTGLPLPSHDLWEEQYGVFTYTASTVVAALKTAAQFADMLGKEVAAKRWASTASDIQLGILHRLVQDDGSVLKSLRPLHGTMQADPTIDASSFYGLFRFGVLEVDDPRLVRAYETTLDRLSSGVDREGIARYEGDNYFRTRGDVSGNPWIITTLWVAEYEIARAKSLTDLSGAQQRLQWVVDRASQAGLMAEQYVPGTHEPVSVRPLAWSHAAYIETFLAYIEKLQELGACSQ